MKFLLLFFLIICNFCEHFIKCDNNESKSKNSISSDDKKEILLIISYDGFRNEYLKRNVSENMLEFRRNGVYADYMMNVFPTKTLTNHHSISTGYYPDTHGILANSLYDTKEGALIYGPELFHFNSEIQPIWIVNQKYGGKSGCSMWPGSEYEYSNETCSYILKYNASIPLEKRVDIVISWLTETENPPNLVMFYSEQPDKLAHMVGPDSQNITDMIKKLDLLTKYIQDKLTENDLINRTNVIHLSDHGMDSVKPPKFINLTQCLDPDTVKMYGTSPVLQIVPQNISEEEIYKKLQDCSKENGNFKVYTTDTLLEKWHAKNSRRWGPIIAMANHGYAFQDMWDAAKFYLEKFRVPFNENSNYGVHGYENDYELMHAYFMAKGPSLKTNGTKVEQFEIVDLFSLFIKLLKIDNMMERDGKYSRVLDITTLANPKGLHLTEIIVVALLCVILVAIAIFYFSHQFKKRQNYNVT